MQPIIRRTITITITETWTITWPDGHETTWQETQAVVWSAGGAPGAPLSVLAEEDETALGIPDGDAVDADDAAATPTEGE